jgi:hypothetical protein
MNDKTHVEHNESASTLIADISRDIDFGPNGANSRPYLFDRFVGAGDERRR